MSLNSDQDRLGDSAERRPDVSVDPVLQAKYLDYCSARLSEVFLSLSDERAYELMEEAAREADLTVGSLSFQAMMRLVTRKLQHSVPLPDMESWALEYTRSPERFDPYLLGLWESAEGETEGQDP